MPPIRPLLLSVLSLVLTSAITHAAEQPNIILLMGDDHGWEETSYYDHPHVQTPVLDEMAASGLRLDHFYAGHPSCSPTRGSVLTGRHPNRYATFSPAWSIRPEEVTIAQILKDAGYATGHFGKWHLGPVKASSPTNPGAMGFDTWVSHDNFFEMNPHLSRQGGPPEVFEGESSAIVIEETLKFIKTAESDEKPFFAVVWFGSPHEPYSGLPEDLALYDNLPAKYPDTEVSLTSNETGLQVKRPLGDVLRERYAEITAMDRAIGTLRDSLKQSGLRENTLLWYCGDNGTPRSGVLATPFRGRKGQVYEGGIRVPGVIEWPAGIPAPVVSKLPSVTSDMLPTLCALTGQALPKRPLDGIDITGAFDGSLQSRPSPLHFWMYETKQENKDLPYIDPELQTGTTPLVKLSGGIATRNFKNYHHPEITEDNFAGDRVIQEGPYKLIVSGGIGKEPQRMLFDLEKDPAETSNLIKEHPEVATELEKKLRGWQQSVLESLTEADYR